MVITACVIQSKNELFHAFNFKGFHLTKRKEEKYKEDKSMNSELKKRG